MITIDDIELISSKIAHDFDDIVDDVMDFTDDVEDWADQSRSYRKGE